MENETWVKVVSRPVTALTCHLMLSGHQKVFDLLGETICIDWRSEIKKSKASVFFSPSLFRNITRIFIKRTQENKDFGRHILEKGFQSSDRLVQTAQEISSGELKVLTNKQLIERFSKYIDAFFDFMPSLLIPLAIEQYLTENVKNKVGEDFQKLTAVQKDSDAFLEQKDLSEIAILKKQGADIKERLTVHAERFSYLGLDNSFLSMPWGTDYFEARVNDLALGNPAEMLKALLENRTKELAEYKKLVSKVDMDSLKNAELLQDYMFFRSYRIDAMKKAQWALKPLLVEIASRFNLKFEYIVWFLWPEILKLLETGEKPNFEPRKENFTVGLLDGKLFWNTNSIKEETLEYAGPIKGKIACKGGLVKGKVRIIRGKEDMQNFKEGEILVTAMTTPDFVMIMKKAAAIVTDEGGILCHAAIVSREFGVPCVIGTKIATRVLKTGDEVIVDADKGIVEKTNGAG